MKSPNAGADASCYRLGEFELWPARCALLRAGQRVRLTQKPFQVLLYLVENRGRLVSRAELLERFWGGREVYDVALTRCLSFVRKALDDQREEPRYVETRWAEGYRYIGPFDSFQVPTSAADPGKADPPRVLEQRQMPRAGVLRRALPGAVAVALLALAAWLAWDLREAPSQPPIRSLAVLPLVNLAGDPASEYFGDGLSERLIAQLSRASELRVISWTSVARLKAQTPTPEDIGRQLNVAAVLEGSVRRSPESVRVAVRLVSSHDGRVLWARDFREQPLPDLFALQDQIAETVAAQLRVQFETMARPTRSVEAYQLYLQGRYAWNKRTEAGLQRAVELFNEAIAIDPEFAPAYAALADSHLLLPYYAAVPAPEAVARARAAAEKALALDPSLGEAHAVLAEISASHDWNWPAAEAAFRRALTLSPGYATAHQWYGEQLAYRERFDEAVVQIELAHQLDPLSPIIAMLRGSPYLWRRDYGRALDYYQKALALDPDFMFAHYSAALCYEGLGRWAEAIAAHQQALPKVGSFTVAPSLAWTYAASGRHAEARRILAELLQQSGPRRLSAYKRATIHAGLGENDTALRWLEQSAEDRDERLMLLRVDHHFDGLRRDARYLRLVQRVGLLP